MKNEYPALKTQVLQTGAWSMVLPALAVWPFLSALPIFSLFGGGLSLVQIGLNLVLVCTGFWAFAGAYLGYRLLRAGNRAAEATTTRKDRGLALGAFATIWTIAYALVALFTR